MRELTKLGKRRTIVLPASLRRRFKMVEGPALILEECRDGILVHPALALAVEVDSDERKVELLLSNASTLWGILDPHPRLCDDCISPSAPHRHQSDSDDPLVARLHMIRCLSLWMLVSVTTSLASAQPRLGDLLVTEGNASYVAYVDRSSGIMTTLAALPGKPLPLMMAANNTDVLVFELNQPGWSIWHVTPAGVVTTVGQGSRTGEGNQTGCDWMQDGHILVCTSAFGTRGWLRSMDLSTNTCTTLYTAPISHFRHAAVNTDNGNALICRWDAFGDLFERDLTARTLTTIISGLDRANNVDPEPATGNTIGVTVQ